MTDVPHLRPLGIGEILDVALKIAWRNAGTLVRVVIFVVLPVQIVSTIITLSATPNGINSTDFTYNRSNPPTVGDHDLAAFVAGAGVTALLGVIGSTLASGACFRAIASAYLGQRTGWRESLGYALRRLHSILWVTILGGLLALGGAVLCILPGIYLWVAFSLAVPIVLTEDVRGRRALGRSRRLVQGFWWRVFAVLVLGSLLKSILGGAITALVVGVSSVSDSSDSLANAVLNVVAGTLGSLVTTPFVAAFVTVLYFDLRVRKEGYDLQLLAERIGVEPPAGRLPAARPEEPAGGSEQPPFWPPPPGWKPGGAAE